MQQRLGLRGKANDKSKIYKLINLKLLFALSHLLIIEVLCKLSPIENN